MVEHAAVVVCAVVCVVVCLGVVWCLVGCVGLLCAGVLGDVVAVLGGWGWWFCGGLGCHLAAVGDECWALRRLALRPHGEVAPRQQEQQHPKQEQELRPRPPNTQRSAPGPLAGEFSRPEWP